MIIMIVFRIINVIMVVDVIVIVNVLMIIKISNVIMIVNIIKIIDVFMIFNIIIIILDVLSGKITYSMKIISESVVHYLVVPLLRKTCKSMIGPTSQIHRICSDVSYNEINCKEA